MIRSKKVRSVAAACLVAGSGCASAPPPRPTLKDCPPGTKQTYERFELLEGHSFVLIPPANRMMAVQVREGEIHNVPLGYKWGKLREGTLFSGRLFFGKDRVYGLLTQLHLPDGETVPVCLELTQEKPGTEILPRSTSRNVWINASVGVTVVY